MSQFASTLYPQANPTNPILVELREDFAAFGNRKRQTLGEYLDYLSGACSGWPEVHQRHAIRVLERLVVLAG